MFNIGVGYCLEVTTLYKGAITRYGLLTWEFVDNTLIFCLSMTIFMVHLIFYAILLSIYDIMYDITTTPEGTLL